MKENSIIKEILDFIKDLIIVVIIVLFIRTYFILPFQISGQSMYETFYNKEFIIVDRFSYLNIPYFGSLSEPTNWDVIVFRPYVSKTKEFFIKRIIWVSWDTIKIENGRVYLKKDWEEVFVELKEDYLSSSNNWATYVNWDTKEYVYKVPENSYFVLWDNRNWSTDSRSCFSSCILWKKTNFINRKDIVWKVFIDLWFFDISSFAFIHPNLGISTKPRFFDHFGSSSY